MFKTVIFLVGIAALAAEPVAPPHPASERIMGGSVTTIGVYPFATPLLHSTDLLSYRQSCGGSILNSRSILSAGHCFYLTSIRQWRVRVGSTFANSGGTVHNTAQFIVHPNYNHWQLDNDIAILRTASTIIFIPNAAQPGSIAGPNYNLADNQIVWAIGWGATSVSGTGSNQLRHVQIWTINQVICRNRYIPMNWPVTDNMLCSGWLDVGGRDQCQGDSGGPLLHNGVIVGVSSWGYQCGLARYPGVNARVTRFSVWIQNNA